MARLAEADITISRAIERANVYRQRYAHQIAVNAELKAACRWLFEPWKPGHPNLDQVLERIRTIIEADEGD